MMQAPGPVSEHEIVRMVTIATLVTVHVVPWNIPPAVRTRIVSRKRESVAHGTQTGNWDNAKRRLLSVRMIGIVPRPIVVSEAVACRGPNPDVATVSSMREKPAMMATTRTEMDAIETVSWKRFAATARWSAVNSVMTGTVVPVMAATRVAEQSKRLNVVTVGSRVMKSVMMATMTTPIGAQQPVVVRSAAMGSSGLFWRNATMVTRCQVMAVMPSVAERAVAMVGSKLARNAMIEIETTMTTAQTPVVEQFAVTAF